MRTMDGATASTDSVGRMKIRTKVSGTAKRTMSQTALTIAEVQIAYRSVFETRLDAPAP